MNDGIVNVVRCFEADNVIHVAGKVDPISDVATIVTELALADLATVEKAQERNAKIVRSGNKEAVKLDDLLEQVAACLNQGRPACTMQLDASQLALLKPLCLLTGKPVMHVANVGEKGFMNNLLLARMEAFAAGEGAPVVDICAALESEISVLSDDERQEFLADVGLAEPGLNRLIRAASQLLGLQTYFTAGVKEVRAWTIHVGDTAPQAAGVIHGEFEQGFIRAEVIGYDDFIACKGEAGAK